MSDRESTARARELGAELRRLRESTGYSAYDFAKIVGWSNSKVSRIETGLRGITEIDVVRFAAYCRATPAEMEDLVARCREAEVPGYWCSSRLSSKTFHERTATASMRYQPLVVPGLLQTENYARALIERDVPEPEKAQHLVRARMEQQALLTRCQFEFFIHEQALRLPVVDGPSMNEQLLKLVLLAEHPWVSIRVVPAKLGARSIFGSEFALHRYEDAEPLVYLEQGPVSLFIEDHTYVESYRRQVRDLRQVALDRGASREFLAAMADEFDQPAYMSNS